MIATLHPDGCSANSKLASTSDNCSHCRQAFRATNLMNTHQATRVFIRALCCMSLSSILARHVQEGYERCKKSIADAHRPKAPHLMAWSILPRGGATRQLLGTYILDWPDSITRNKKCPSLFACIHSQSAENTARRAEWVTVTAYAQATACRLHFSPHVKSVAYHFMMVGCPSIAQSASS